MYIVTIAYQPPYTIAKKFRHLTQNYSFIINDYNK